MTVLTTSPRLLDGTRADRPLTLREHHAVHGRLPDLSSDDVLAVADAASLRGRGGAGFPVGRKLRTARDASRRPVVVANGSEGEPAVRKDRTLLARAPHLVLDGLALAARAVDARTLFLCVHRGGPAEQVRAALAERRDVRATVVEVPDRYVSGEAGALVRGLSGAAHLPATRDVPLAVRGLRGRPTVVQNVESLAALAVAARLGGDGYRAVGDRDEPGTLLVTLAGDVPSPGVVEVPTGTPLSEVVGGAGPLQALLVGGYAGAWLPVPAALDVPLTAAGLRAAGGTLGAALVVALSESACGLATTARLARWLADQTAGQCGPCVRGLPALADALDRLVAGDDVGERVRVLCGLVDGRGACAHPDGAALLVRSALTAFAEDLPRHRAAACGRPPLRLP